MKTNKKNDFISAILRWKQNFLGKPLRILLLMLTDFFWSFAVLSAMLCRSETNSSFESVVRFSLTEAIIVVLLNAIFKCYHGSVLNPGAALNRVEEIRRLTFSVLLSYGSGYLLLLIREHWDAKLCFPLSAALFVTIAGFPVMRFLTRFTMKKTGLGQIRTFIAGAGKTARTVGCELEASAYYGYEIVGYFDDDENTKTTELHGKKWLGKIADAPRLAKAYNVHNIICCLPPLILPRIVPSYTKAFNHVLVIPSAAILPITAFYPILIGFIGGFEFQNRLLFLIPRITKRLTEFIIAVCALVLLLPLFLLLIVLVKCSGHGPVFYTAKRLGLGGREIKVFKFRTMVPDAEAKLEPLLEENPEMKKQWETKFKLIHDPRVTKIGRFLRRTSLDELPQFINVLRGEMAIVGPRPIVPEEVKYYGKKYDFFKRVRPGITGLWQVSGRNDLDYEQRVRLDMFYVMNWSAWLDWFILCKTVLVIFMNRGSY